jgi:hypothetical protein
LHKTLGDERRFLVFQNAVRLLGHPRPRRMYDGPSLPGYGCVDFATAAAGALSSH